MAGNPKTPKAIAPKSGRPAASTKGVRVGVNPKATTQSSAVTSKMSKYKMGGSMKGKKC